MLFIYGLKHVLLLISVQPSPSSSREHPWPTPLHSSRTNSAFRLSHSYIRYHRHNRYYSWSRHYHNTKSFLISTSVSKLLTPLQSSLAQTVSPVADTTHPFKWGHEAGCSSFRQHEGRDEGPRLPPQLPQAPHVNLVAPWRHYLASHPAAAASARAGSQHSPSSPPCNRPRALRGEDANHLMVTDPPRQGNPLPQGDTQPPQGNLPPQGDQSAPSGRSNTSGY